MLHMLVQIKSHDSDVNYSLRFYGTVKNTKYF